MMTGEAPRGENIVMMKIRRIRFVSPVLAGLLLALAAPAQASTYEFNGNAYFNPSPGTPCPEPPPEYDSYAPLVMEGSLDGCWYTNIETARTTPDGVYLETGTELFVGQLDGGPEGTFTTTYRFQANLDSDGAELRGRCQHPLVAGSGTGGFSGATGQINFTDIVGETVTYLYKGRIIL
jgi:hypothetical protein